MATLTLSSASADESYGYLNFVATLSAPLSYDITLDYRTLFDGSATADDVSGYLSSKVTIAAGDTSATISLRASHDYLAEFDEFLTLELLNPSLPVKFAGNQPLLRATGVILDNDGAPDLSVNVRDPIIEEGDKGTKVAVFEVRLSRPAPSALTLKYNTKDGSALAGQDYEAMSGQLDFKAGQEVAYVRVPVLGDKLFEASETFNLLVKPPSGSGIGVADSAGTALIMDDDSSYLPEISVQGSVAQESYGYLNFNVILSEVSSSDVTVEYRRVLYGSSSESDTSGYTTGTVTIAAGQRSATASLRASHDYIEESDEVVGLEFYNPKGAVLAGKAVTLSATGVILDNDGGGSDVALGGAPVSLTEYKWGDAHGLHGIPITLSRASSTSLTFKVKAVSGTAREGSDFKLLTDTITFAPGQTTASAKVRVYNDLHKEGLESFQLAFTKKSGADFSGHIVNQKVTIVSEPVFTNRSETVRLTNGNDVARALGGDDEVFGLAGNDKIYGGTGRDLLEGGKGNDLLDGGDGLDGLWGGAGLDVLIGGRGADRLFGGAGRDTADYSTAKKGVTAMLASPGKNKGDAAGDTYKDIENLTGSKHDDALSGNKGANHIRGGKGNDTQSGLGGKDLLEGQTGRDKLLGGGGNDVLDGGVGNDILLGGGGRDRFLFNSGRDQINDLRNGVDTIVLDSDLWVGKYSAQRVVDRYGYDLGNDVELRFANGNTLKVKGIGNLDTLADNIDIA